MKKMIHVFAAVIVLSVSGYAFAGAGHSHGASEPVSKEQVTERAAASSSNSSIQNRLLLAGRKPPEARPSSGLPRRVNYGSSSLLILTLPAKTKRTCMSLWMSTATPLELTTPAKCKAGDGAKAR